MKPLLKIAAVLAFAMASTAHAVPSNKWRLEFSGAAESDGEIVLAITPQGGSTREVVVPVGRADGENEIASKAVAALTAAAGTDYDVERDDGEDVLVKRRDGAPLLEVGLVRNSVKDVRVEFDAE